MTVNIGVLVSGEGTNLQAIIDSIDSHKITNAAVSVVISNKPDAPALKRAEKQGIDAVYIDPTDYKGRRWEYDQLTLKALREHGVTSENGLVVNAGYMRILSPEFVKNFWMREMNIHPSLLPSFPGLDGPKQALDYGVKVTGCTVHFVDEGVDTGPVILQEALPVLEEDTVETLTNRIHEAEHRLYPEAIRLFTEGKLAVEGRRVKVLL
jgi:phosphoribosylglycinamide formyltransferase 1